MTRVVIVQIEAVRVAGRSVWVAMYVGRSV